MIASPSSLNASHSPRFSSTGMLVVVGAHAAILAGLLLANRPLDTPVMTSSMTVRVIAPSIEMPPAPAPQKSVTTRQTPPSPVKPAEEPKKAIAIPVSETGTLATARPQQPAPSAAPGNSAPSEKTETASGGSYSEPRFDTAYLRNPAPAYPPLSRRMGEEGKVLLRVFVESNGLPSQVQIKTSSGSPRLDQAALEAVRRWKFTPARRGSTVLAAWVIVPIVFNLKN